VDNRAAAISGGKKVTDAEFNAKGSARTFETFDMLLGHCSAVIDSRPFLPKSY
jgi:hypothetical protein